MTQHDDELEEAKKQHFWPEKSLSSAYEDGFDNGASWQAEKSKESQMNDDELEKYAEEYAKDTAGNFEYAKSWEEVIEIFKAGARWKAEKEANNYWEAQSVAKANAALTEENAFLKATIQELQKEVDEQCRLNGMGQERELKLITENARLIACLERYDDVAAYHEGASGRFYAKEALSASNGDALAAIREAMEALRYYRADTNGERAYDALAKLRKVFPE